MRERVAIVVGVGAEAGLGARLCTRLAREGVHVAHVISDGGIAGERLQRFVEFVRAEGEDVMLDLDLRPFKEQF